MINVSNAFRRLLYEGKRNYLEYVDITLGSGKELSLRNKHLWQGGLSFEDAVSDDNSFNIGSAIINKCTVVINNIYDDYSEYDFANAKVIAGIGLELPDGTVESRRKGTYTVNDPKYNGGTITLSCLDNMAKFDKLYSNSPLIYPATLGQIVRDACSQCYVALQTFNFPRDDFVINERPGGEATTFREVISWAAQIAGCFCRCDVYGRLEVKWYDQEALEAAGLDGGIFDKANPSIYESGDSADGGSFKPWNVGYEFDGGTFKELRNVNHITSNYSIDISTDDVVITGVRVLEKTKQDEKDAIVTYQSGEDGYVISIENNELIQGGAGQLIAEWLGQQLIGFRFRRANVSHPSDPTIEAGDVGFLTDRKGNTYRIVISSTRFSTGGSQTTVSSAENPARNSAARFSAETKTYVENRKLVEKERTDREEALENLKNRIDSSSGLFVTEDRQPDGSDVIYMHDKPTLDESKNVWKLTAEAWAVSTDGGETYNAGISVDGDMIARLLNAEGINAGWINAGELSIKTKAGNETFYADTETGQVRIVADSFSLTSGKTIEGIAQEAASDKNKVFTSTPTPPYNVGDLWMASDKSEVKVCVTAKAEGKAFSSNDWKKRDNYIDASKAEAAASDAAEKSWSEKTNADIFKKLMYVNGSWRQGLATDENGNIYINASYINAGAMSANHIRGGTLTLGGVNNTNGALKILNSSGTQVGQWNNAGITATAGTIGGFTIGASKIYAGDANTGVIAMQKPGSGMNWAFAVGGTSHSDYSDCPFRVSKGGALYAESGKIGGFLIDDKERLKTTISGDCDFYIGGGPRWPQAFVLYNSANAPIAYLLNSGAFACKGVTAPSLEGSGDLSLRAGGSREIKFIVGGAQKGHFDKNGLSLDHPIQRTGIRYLGIYATTGTVYALGDSSRRYKDVLKPMALEDAEGIYEITPVWAKYKPGYLAEDDERKNINFPMLIAEDVDAHLPYAADHNPDGSVENWNHRVLIPYMIQALKEQKKEIDELKTMISNQ